MTSKGVDKYINSLVKNKNNYLVLVYGSSITKYQNSDSDVDIFVVSDTDKSYREATLIDGTLVEVITRGIGDTKNAILAGVTDRNQFMESVLYTSLVKKDSCGLLGIFREYLDILKEGYCRKEKNIPYSIETALNEHYNNYHYCNSLYDYYNLLESIRIANVYLNDLSQINPGKVGTLYNDLFRAKTIYRLDMPSQEFIDAFNKSVSVVSLDNLDELFSFIDFKPMGNFFDHDNYQIFSSMRIKTILIHLNKLVDKVKRSLISGDLYKDYLYFVVLHKLYLFYIEIYGELTEEFSSTYEAAKNLVYSSERIEVIDKLFHILEGNYRFDYKNYRLEIK